jgi:hypothetical protein
MLGVAARPLLAVAGAVPELVPETGEFDLNIGAVLAIAGAPGFGATSGGIGVEAKGTGADIAALGCEVGVAEGDDAAGVVAATGVGAVQPGLLDELHEIPVKETRESPALHCVRPIRL